MAVAEEHAPSLLGTRARRRLAAAGLLLIVPAYAEVDHWGRTHAFLINTTLSLPDWAFLVEREKTPARGDLIFFIPPESSLIWRSPSRCN